MKIGIDCGHTLTGKGTGATGCGYKEQNLTRELGKIVMEMLIKEGHTVFNCTVDKSTSQSQQLIDRVNKANKQTLDLFVSIHFNSCVNDQKGNGYTTGTEVLIYSTSSKSKPYADRIVKNISDIGLKNRGVKTSFKAFTFITSFSFIPLSSDILITFGLSIITSSNTSSKVSSLKVATGLSIAKE